MAAISLHNSLIIHIIKQSTNIMSPFPILNYNYILQIQNWLDAKQAIKWMFVCIVSIEACINDSCHPDVKLYLLQFHQNFNKALGSSRTAASTSKVEVKGKLVTYKHQSNWCHSNIRKGFKLRVMEIQWFHCVESHNGLSFNFYTLFHP